MNVHEELCVKPSQPQVCICACEKCWDEETGKCICPKCNGQCDER